MWHGCLNIDIVDQIYIIQRLIHSTGVDFEELKFTEGSDRPRKHSIELSFASRLETSASKKRNEFLGFMCLIMALQLTINL